MRPFAKLSALLLALVLSLWIVSSLRSRGEPVVGGGSGKAPGGDSTQLDSLEPASEQLTASPPEGPSEVAGSRTELPAACRLRVVMAEGGTPVPGGRVWVQREDVDEESVAFRRAMQRSNDWEYVLQAGFGIEYVADANGEVLVPRSEQGRMVAAAAGEFHGESGIGPGDSEGLVELSRYRSLAFEVVDAAGAPVEGAVIVMCWGEINPLYENGAWITDEHGRVSLPKLEDQIGADIDPPLFAALGAGVPCEPEMVRLSFDELPREPIRFVAGAHGSVVVQATTQAGASSSASGFGSLSIEEERLVDWSLPRRAGASVTAELIDGRMEFACVGLDLPLSIWLHPEGRGHSSRKARGPVAANEVLRILVPLGQPADIVRGRLTGSATALGSGEPATATLAGHCEASGQRFEVPIETDGPFETSLPSWGTPVRLAEPWKLQLSRPGGPAVGTLVVPELVEATSAEGGAVLDFGEVRFEPSPALARVRVTDPAGTGIPRAKVESGSPNGVTEVSCDQEGRCLVGYAVTGPPTMLFASERGWLGGTWKPLDPTLAEQILVLHRPASLNGQLQLPGTIRNDELYLSMSVTPSPGFDGYRGSRLRMGEAGAFRFEELAPGTGQLRIFLGELELRVIEDIGLKSGETTELAPIDLRDLLHVIDLQVQLASGEPWSGGHLEVIEPDGLQSTPIPILRGRATFLAARAKLDLWVVGRGARATRFEGVIDGARLVLPVPPAIELRLPPGLPLPPSPWTLMVQAYSTNSDPEFQIDVRRDLPETAIQDHGRAVLQVPVPGEYSLSWWLRHAGTGVELPIEPAAGAQTIHVADSPAIKTLEALLAAEDLARTLEQATRMR